MLTLIAYFGMDYFDNHNVLVYTIPVMIDLMFVNFLANKAK